MNILSEGICTRSTSYILLNQGHIQTFSLIPKLGDIILGIFFL